MTSQSLKITSAACKGLAIVGCVVVPLWILRPRWGLSPIADAQIIGLAVLSLIPNRWLVSSRVTFVIFLLLTLFPFRVFLHISAFRGLDLGLAIGGAIVESFFFVPLPLSLLLSRIRLLRRDKLMYA